MNDKNKLIYSMTIFFVIVFVLFSLIVINEKKNIILIPKVEKKINAYIDDNYKLEKENFIISKTTYKSDLSSFQVKVKNKENKNLYFFINYKNKKITDTYKNDYLEGKTLLTNLEKQTEKEINNTAEIEFSKTLNNYTTNVKEKLINNDNVKLIPIYTVKKEILVKENNPTTISTEIINYYKYLKELNFNPKEYIIIIENDTNPNLSFKIENLTDNLINNSINEIISAIIKNDKNIKTKYNISYKYIN